MQDIEKLIVQFELPARPICFRQRVSKNSNYLIDLLDGQSVVLEQIDTTQFAKPEAMMCNALAVSKCLSDNLIAHIEFYHTHDSKFVCEYDDKSWRCKRYLDRMHEIDLPSSHEDAQKATVALANFHSALGNIPLSLFKETLSDYHNTPKLFDDLRAAVDSASEDLKNLAAREISFALRQRKYASILLSMHLPNRIIHNNISHKSFLLSDDEQSGCVISSYDYAMSGLLCFDFGAFVCSMCHNCADDEGNMEKINFDIDRYAEITKAYIACGRSKLNKDEVASLAAGCVVMSFEQGIKYLLNYLVDDSTYSAEYPEQNLYRARVQLMLCMQMQYYYKEMENIVNRCL